MITMRMATDATSLRERMKRDESGIGLVELLVAMLIFGIVITLVANMYVSMTRTVQIGGSVNNSTKAASLGMNELSRVIRFATGNPVSGQPIDDPAFVEAGRETITVYSYVDTVSSAVQPVKVKFSLDASRRLIETRYAAYSLSGGYWGFSSTPLWTRTLTGQVMAPGAGEPYLFTYLQDDGTAIAVPAAGLASSQFSAIAAVQVTLKLKADDGTTANPVVLQNTVGLPNLGIHRTGQ